MGLIRLTAPLVSACRRAREIRRDERGSVMLLSGMMAFLLAIMALFTLDTSQGIYNRIVAQNSVDAAAMTSALWQARGDNLLQLLNNAHYDFNAIIYGLEWAALQQCQAAVSGVASDYSNCPPDDPFCPTCCFDSVASTEGECEACSQAGPLNDTHDRVAGMILNVQSVITTVVPLLALDYANQIAHDAGADDLTAVVPQYLKNFGGAMGGLLGLSGSLPTPPELPGLYALPLQLVADPDLNDVLLNAHQTEGDNWPWKWNTNATPTAIPYSFGPEGFQKPAAEILWYTGKYACGFDIWQIVFAGHEWLSEFQDPSEWGWDDSYYQGYPGFTTWIAGKVSQPELAKLGLGSLKWFNDTAGAPAEVNYGFLNQKGYRMYTGPAKGSAIGSTPMQIPAFLALASSQVEGSDVVGKDTDNILYQLDLLDMPPVDSVPRLISVYLPTLPGQPPVKGSDLWIYH